MTRRERRSRPGEVELRVSWGNDVTVVLRLSAELWSQIQRGTPIRLEGEGYQYEGLHYRVEWDFSGGPMRSVSVEYTPDGGTLLDRGVGFEGSLAELTIRTLS